MGEHMIYKHVELHHSSCTCYFCRKGGTFRAEGDKGYEWLGDYEGEDETHHAKCGCEGCRYENLAEHKANCSGCWICELPYTDCEANEMYADSEVGKWDTHEQYQGYEEGFLFGTKWYQDMDDIPF